MNNGMPLPRRCSYGDMNVVCLLRGTPLMSTLRHTYDTRAMRAIMRVDSSAAFICCRCFRRGCRATFSSRAATLAACHAANDTRFSAAAAFSRLMLPDVLLIRYCRC